MRELISGQPRGVAVKSWQGETETNYLLLNLHLKVSALIALIRKASVEFVNGPDGLSQWWDDVRTAGIYDWQDTLKERFGCGLGVIAVGFDNGQSFLQYCDVRTCVWSPEYGYRNPSWVARKVTERKVCRYEYWDASTHAWLDERMDVIEEHSNPLGIIPVRFTENFSVPSLPFPVSDVELAYPQQLIINEVQAAILEGARRGQGLYEVREGDLMPDQVWKLSEPGEQVIVTESGQAIRHVNGPPLNPEWVALESMGKARLDEHMGVSEYLRGAMPTANNLQFATQVLAALGAQNLRMESDWTPIKETYEWAAYAWLRMAHATGEVHQVGDKAIHAGEIDLSQVTVRVEESVSDIAVSEVGINPAEVRSAVAGL